MDIATLQDKIKQAQTKSNFSSSKVQLLAATKYAKSQDLIGLYNQGIKIFGENYVQQAQQKKEYWDQNYPNQQVQWQAIGHLQTNKVKKALEIFDCIQSVDSLKLAYKLDQQAAKIHKKIPVLIQVNLGQEKQKSGFILTEVENSLKQILSYKFLEIQGFMAVAPLTKKPEDSRLLYRNLRQARDKWSKHFKRKFPELSMGMSQDYEVAVEEGATCVRLGRIIFE